MEANSGIAGTEPTIGQTTGAEAQVLAGALIAALASARWPLPMENPLKACTLRPAL